jgi:NitT/TauT family transport system substrate-binding protein
MLPTRLARLVTLVAGVVLVAACTSSASPSSGASSSAGSGGPSAAASKALVKVRYVLPWVVQGESAGNLVAKQKGFYADAGLDVEIVPGGPDVRASALLASGSAEFSAGPVPGLLTARAEGIPLVALYTQNQSDGLVWVCKNKTGIKSFADLAGKRVGVWFGSNDSKLLFALAKAGVAANSVQILPQKFSMIEFFEDKFDCAGATVWNELHVVLDAGYTVGTKADDITILDPAKE